MANETDSIIRAELDPGEELLWSGRPKQGVRFTPADIFLVPFSLMWGGFAIFWEAMVIATGAPIFMVLFGIPFVLVGLYLIVGRFFVEAKQREKTCYGVTDQRVLIMTGLFSRSVKSLDLATLPQLTLTEKSDGSGSIQLGSLGPFPIWMADVGWPGMSQHLPPALSLIENARDVYNTVRDAQRVAKSS